MLRLLRIRNLAVIEAVDVEFEPGFTVLTGETGAGKSILVEAVGLLLGARASADLVRTGEAQATIEALFDHPVRGECIVRREVTSQGRSRSFIDGALATAGSLRVLADDLIELHGQHEHQALLDPQTHLPLLDTFARLEGAAAGVAGAWHEVQALREQRDRLRLDAREKVARLDLIAFQLGEIEAAALRPGEDDELRATRQVLANAERVQRLCEEAYAGLYDRDDAVLATLGQVWKRVGELAAIDPAFAPFLEARDGIKGQLEELAFHLRRYADGVDASPARLQAVEDRLALVDRLQRKYGPSLDEVIAAGERLARERDLLRGGTQSADEVEQALAAAGTRYLDQARQLSTRRRAAARDLAGQLEAELGRLAMAQTRFEVRFAPAAEDDRAWGERGIDRAEFFVSPNPGEELRPLARIVSGGELSRVMLALKTIAAGTGAGKTVVFDEIDAGIGGQVAEVVGERLAQLGGRDQVLCITHLPQIAARGTTHLHIAKAVRGGRTLTAVHRLDPAGRIDEISRMIGGRTVSEPIRASAREMLAHQAKGKQKAKGESESR